jgi:hypothetical protein
MYKFVLLIVCIILISCSTSDVPKNILSEDKMRIILWQQIKADIYTRENLVNDSLKKNDLQFENEKLQTQIFKNNGITKEDFYESYNYYLANEDKLSIMIDTIIAKQTRANFEALSHQLDSYKPKPKDIFMEDLLKKRLIFSMNPDTLKNPFYNNTKTDTISNTIPDIQTTDNIFKKRKFNPQKK